MIAMGTVLQWNHLTNKRSNEYCKELHPWAVELLNYEQLVQARNIILARIACKLRHDYCSTLVSLPSQRDWLQWVLLLLQGTLDWVQDSLIMELMLFLVLSIGLGLSICSPNNTFSSHTGLYWKNFYFFKYYVFSAFRRCVSYQMSLVLSYKTKNKGTFLNIIIFIV